jgi:hypothetical protein
VAPDLLTTVRRELDARLRQLRPLRAEYEHLVTVAEALDATDTKAAASLSAAKSTATGSQTSPRRRGRRDRAARATLSAPSTTRARKADKRKRAPRGAARQAILAALEHGSHTASELTSVTSMTGPNIHGNLRRLLREGTIRQAKRDGKSAYALSSASGES